MRRQRGIGETLLIILIVSAVVVATIGGLAWRVSSLTKDRDEWKGKAESAKRAGVVTNEVLTGYADDLKDHASEPDVRAAVDKLCNDLRVPGTAGADNARAPVNPGHRPAAPKEDLATDLIATDENKSQLRACQAFIRKIREDK